MIDYSPACPDDDLADIVPTLPRSPLGGHYIDPATFVRPDDTMESILQRLPGVHLCAPSLQSKDPLVQAFMELRKLSTCPVCGTTVTLEVNKADNSMHSVLFVTPPPRTRCDACLAQILDYNDVMQKRIRERKEGIS